MAFLGIVIRIGQIAHLNALRLATCSSTRLQPSPVLLALEAAEESEKTVALSTAEAEYYSASTAAVEVMYLWYLLQNMGFAPKKWTPAYADNLNKVCIECGNNIIGGRERAKHIDIRKHIAHEAIQNGHLRLVQVDTSEQLADIFTKGLHTPAWKV